MMAHFEGLHELQVKLKECQNLDAVKTVVKKNGSRLQSKSMDKAPVGTPESTGIKGYVGGTLKRGITLDIKDNGQSAVVESTVHYAGYVEYGTRFMKAQPYVGPSFNEVKGQFKRDLEKLVK